MCMFSQLWQSWQVFIDIIATGRYLGIIATGRYLGIIATGRYLGAVCAGIDTESWEVHRTNLISAMFYFI